MMIRCLPVIVSGFMVATAGCRDVSYPDQTARYGVAYNETRVKLGIPTLPGDWRVEQENGSQYIYIKWYSPPPAMGIRQPGREYKTIQIDAKTGRLMSETDEYCSGRQYQDEDGVRSNEDLYVRYHYWSPDGRYQAGSWSMLLSAPNHPASPKSLDEARILLASWGLDWEGNRIATTTAASGTRP